MKKAIATQEVLGIYLSCLEETLAYNLPTLIPIGKHDEKEVKTALSAILKAHPHLNAELSTKEGILYQEEVEAPLSLKVSEVKEIDRASLVKPFVLLNSPLYRFELLKTPNGNYLFSDFHHVLMDGFSLTLFYREFAKALEGKEIPPEGDGSYLACVSQEKRREEKEYQDEKKFYEDSYGGVDVDSLPTQDKADDEPSYARFDMEFKGFDDQAILPLLKKAGAHRSSFFLAISSLALGLYSFSDEVSFAFVHNGRGEEQKDAYGMFVRTLPFYINHIDEGKVTDLLSKVEETRLEVIKRSRYSFLDVVKDLSYHPEILISYQGDYYYETELDGKPVEVELLPVKDGKEKITAEIFKKNGSFFARVEYRSDLYEEDSLRHLVASMDHYATEILKKENLEDLDPCGKEDMAILDSYNEHDLSGYDFDRDFVDDIRDRIKEAPERPALCCNGEVLTYGKLGDLSDRIADYLISKKIPHQSVVSILVGRTLSMGFAPVGVLKAGLAYQPLDPSYPDERLSFMMEDADAKLLICERGLEKRIPSYKGPILFIDEVPDLPKLGLPQPKADPHDIYIMLYTSGSTGKPKGVQLEHHNISAFVQWQRRVYGYQPGEGLFAYASFGFDANMFDLYGALTNGVTMHIIPEEMRLDLPRIAKYVKDNHVQHGMMTTQVGRQFTESEGDIEMRTLLVGGEKLVPVEPPKGFTLHNGYGPTECTIIVSDFPVDKLYYRVPIGKVLPLSHAFICDKKMRRVPYGAPGFLFISGHQVARGYLNRPEENKKAFIESPFEKEGVYHKMYHTGDVVRFLKDGTLDFIGRKDGQVKIRGFRIELSEVERVIREYPGVEDATVQAFPAASGGMFIAGYVVSKKQLDLEDLKAFIGSRKPPYMVPEAMMQLDRIPLNQNSKVNKRALPIPTRQKGEIVAPSNEREAKILEVTKKVLGYDEIGVTTDLFEAGLTSISSIRYMGMLSKECGLDLSTKELHDHPTVRALATLNAEEAVEEVITGPYPLTKTQQGIFVEMMAHPGSTIYNIPLLYKLDKGINLDDLEKAIIKAIDNHPSLKGHLIQDKGEVLFSPSEEPVKVERVKGDPAEPFALTPFDLFKGPFYQAKIYEGKEHYLYLDTHHIASDGTSLAVLMEDVALLLKGEPIEPEKKGAAAISKEELEKATPEEIAKQKAHYDSFLSGVDSPSLPRKDYDLPTSSKPLAYSLPLTLDVNKTADFFKKNGIDPNGFFNAVFAYALAKWNGNEDALFSSIYSGRDKAATLRSVTMLVKTLPVYASLEKNEKRVDFVKKVQAQIKKSEENTLYSFAEVSHDYGVKADILFAYQGDGFLPSSLNGKPIELMALPLDDAKAPFSVDCLLKEKGYCLNFEVPENLYLVDTLKGFGKLFDLVAKAFLEDGILETVELMDQEDHERMDVYNATDEPKAYPTYLEYLAREVKAHPQKTMIVGIDEALTYQEFDERTNQIAHALLDNDVMPDDKVVTLTHRIANAFVAREGVLKSGAAFLPIDPAYPDDRVSYIIEDAEAKLVLTTKDIYAEKKDKYPNVKFLLIEEILEKAPKTPVNSIIDPMSLAYCIYTSGSTGKPKGVMIEHHSLANLVDHNPHNYVVREYLENASVTVALASLSFDLSIQEEFIPFANGMTTVMASEDEILNPIDLAKRMIENKVDILTTTPSYVNNVLDIESVMGAFRNLKAIDLGAEAIPSSLIEKMKQKGMKARPYNGYGPTEATVTCTMDEIVSSRITIGFPDANVRTYIVDKELRRLPFGAIGELLIGGDGVARGYIHRDDLNKEKFINFEGIYAYRSGDLARINYDGRIEFFGRKDNQVKLRGLRVELDEIENNMATYPGISRAVVLVKETAEEGQFLVGYYLSEQEVDPSALKAHLAATLTPYMIPKVFVHLTSIPMTQNGKVDKKKLPEPELSRATSSAGRKPKNELEQTIFDIFAHVLGQNAFSIDDDFFDLGGTSLSASKVAMMALEKELPISYGDIFENPTVADLAFLVKHHDDIKKDEEKEEEEPVQEGLDHNVPSEVNGIKKSFAYSRVLLTGATGFLGIHVFRELLRQENTKIIALIRGGKGVSPKDRLSTLLAYYFGDLFAEEIAKRVTFVESDVTASDLQDKLKDENFDLIINCAAVVKHFSNDDSIERVNLGGVKNLIEVALAHKARLVQISTLSVAGENVGNKFPDTKRIHESEIFFGQDISNKYIHSKIKAEEALIEAVNTRGLDGKVIRVGNLMGREKDGEFQVNSGTNSFMNSLRAYVQLGAFPVSAADGTIDFSPIDEVAKTVLLFAATPSQYTVFHSANSHEVELGDVIAALNSYGFTVDIVSDEEFSKRLAEFMKDESKNMAVSSLISYESSSKESRAYILSDNSFSVKALYRLGYKWPITDRRYLERTIESLATLGFFE